MKIIPWKTVPPGTVTISAERLTTSSVSIMTAWNGKKYNSPSLNHKPCHKFVLQTCMLHFSKSTKSQKTFYSSVSLELMRSLQLCVFATVKWVEIILYSVKNKQMEESVILHFQEYNELVFPNFEVCTLPKIISVLIEVLWVFS